MIAIVKYNAGNISSVQNALARLGYKSIVTNDRAVLEKADKVIFPGVGEASSAMAYLKENGLDVLLPKLTQPVLGICLGLQLMCQYSEEGNTTCLGIFNTTVKRFPKVDLVPHMGWNSITLGNQPLFKDLKGKHDLYFVHSYYAEPCKETIATCLYIHPFSGVLQKDNFYACQFHPEKSGKAGEQLLKNFLEL